MTESLTRRVTLDDAEALAEVVVRNRAAMAPTEPYRSEAFYTADGQRTVIEGLLADHAAGRLEPRVVVVDGDVVGRIMLTGIVRGPMQSGVLGYFVDQAHAGRGLATRATAEMLDVAFHDLGLHRVEAGTLPENLASQRVLAKNGFERFGYAPQLLHIAGEWRDHVLFQRLATL